MFALSRRALAKLIPFMSVCRRAPAARLSTERRPEKHEQHHSLEPHQQPPHDPKLSFIDKVKTYGANTMLGVFTNTGNRFDRVLGSMVCTRVSAGAVTCEITVSEALQNAFGTLHGGATSTIVDVVGTMALLSQDPTKPGVTVEMSTSFIAAAKSGTTVRIEGKVLKSGARLGFTQVDIYRKEDSVLIASGRHTKAF